MAHITRALLRHEDLIAYCYDRLHFDNISLKKHEWMLVVTVLMAVAASWDSGLYCALFQVSHCSQSFGCTALILRL